MDTVDWDAVVAGMTYLILYAFFIERALSLFFEHRIYLRHLKGKGYKEPIAFGVALFFVWQWNFDVMAMVSGQTSSYHMGEIVTAAVIAGGSKASVRLFRDILGVQSAAAEAARVPGAVPPDSPPG